ncbi:hypothetical protein ABGN05_06745 [Aquibium sp. LZ166]|uniref:Uncharacterized protein n=1 Tax=Aquibium pacificus TaxID=3153579 RepID=A0ABV3SF08_9HYPH
MRFFIDPSPRCGGHRAAAKPSFLPAFPRNTPVFSPIVKGEPETEEKPLENGYVYQLKFELITLRHVVVCRAGRLAEAQ